MVCVCVCVCVFGAGLAPTFFLLLLFPLVFPFLFSFLFLFPLSPFRSPSRTFYFLVYYDSAPPLVFWFFQSEMVVSLTSCDSYLFPIDMTSFCPRHRPHRTPKRCHPLRTQYVWRYEVLLKVIQCEGKSTRLLLGAHRVRIWRGYDKTILFCSRL